MDNPDPAGIVQLQQLVVRFIGLSVGLAFIALTVMITIGGIRFLLSGGDPKTVQSARALLTYAIIGMAFLALSWVVILLIQAFTGTPLTEFCLGFKPYCAF